jgi:hypothetical protein
LKVHGLCSLDYYQEAVKRLSAQVSNPHFFVFSDDPAWTQENLRIAHPTTYVTHNDGAQAHEDMRLMSLCKHHIIANSSFSWWGAWLAAHPDQIVYAPARWFNRPDWSVDTRDLLPEHWQKIDV